MNERIYVLFTQACYHGDYEPENVPNAVVEKFAELIVKACANLTLDHNGDDYYQGWLDYRDEILKYFGVEK